MKHLSADEARNIGFNQSVTVDGQVLHVQTEVLGHDEIVIRTTVVEGGMVRHTESQVCRAELIRLEQFRVLVEQQHNRHVRQLAETYQRGPH